MRVFFAGFPIAFTLLALSAALLVACSNGADPTADSVAPTGASPAAEQATTMPIPTVEATATTMATHTAASPLYTLGNGHPNAHAHSGPTFRANTNAARAQSHSDHPERIHPGAAIFSVPGLV